MRQHMWAIAAVGLLVAACEPATITEARNQLSRGRVDTIQFTLPIVTDTFDLSSFDLPGDTVLGDLRAIAFDPETVDVGVGDKLEFQNLALNEYVFDYGQMLETAAAGTSVPLGFAPSAVSGWRAPTQLPGDTIRFSTPAGSDVVGMTVDTGTVVRTIRNATSCDGTVSLSLKDANGNTAVAFPPTALAQGSSVTDTIRADGATMSQFVTVELGLTPTGPCTPIAGDTVNADVTFLPMTLAAVDLANVNETFTDSYDPFTTEPRIQAVDTIGVSSGNFTITGQNRLPVPLSVDLTLNGILDGSGQPLAGTLNLPAAPGDGTTASGMIVFDLAGATILTGQALVEIGGSAVASALTVTSLVTDSAVIANGDGDVVVSSLAGGLDPTKTPELTVDVEGSQQIARADVDFGDLEDPVKQATIETAAANLTLRNDADAPMELSGVTLGVVTLTPAGQIPRDAMGDPLYETDTLGNPILVAVVDPGQTTLGIGRATTKTVTLSVAPFLDRLVHLLLDDKPVAVVAAGTVAAGDGQPSRIERTDSLSIGLGLVVGLDVTLPLAGVEYTSTSYQDGLGLEDTTDIDDFVAHIISAAATATVENGTPFGVQVDLGVVPGDVGVGDVFQQPGVVTLDPVSVDPPQVDANGRVTATATDTVGLAMTGTDVRPMLGNDFSAGLRVRLLPGLGGGGRSAMGSTDRVIVRARVNALVQRGGGQ